MYCTKQQNKMEPGVARANGKREVHSNGHIVHVHMPKSANCATFYGHNTCTVTVSWRCRGSSGAQAFVVVSKVDGSVETPVGNEQTYRTMT